ncbi:MAG: alpha/beta hydrolase [Polyangiaceae bacterium]
MTSVFDTPAFNGSLFYPRQDRTEAPDGAEDIFIKTHDEMARIHVRVHESESSLPVLLFFHGNGEVVSDYDRIGAKFAAAGAALAIAWYRAYGESTGTPTYRNTLEDADRVLEGVWLTYERPVIVMGRSLGGACAAELCKVPRDGVIGYVFESSGSDLAGLVRRRGLPVPTFSPEDLATFDPLPKMSACRSPALVLHGAEDRVIEIREAEITHQALAGSRLVRVAGRGHSDISQSAEYWDALAKFIRACAPSPERS